MDSHCTEQKFEEFLVRQGVDLSTLQRKKGMGGR
jgi:hypothetical protein